MNLSYCVGMPRDAAAKRRCSPCILWNRPSGPWKHNGRGCQKSTTCQIKSTCMCEHDICMKLFLLCWPAWRCSSQAQHASMLYHSLRDQSGSYYQIPVPRQPETCPGERHKGCIAWGFLPPYQTSSWIMPNLVTACICACFRRCNVPQDQACCCTSMLRKPIA